MEPKLYWVKFLVASGYCIEAAVDATNEQEATYKAAFRIGVRFGADLDTVDFRAVKLAE